MLNSYKYKLNKAKEVVKEHFVRRKIIDNYLKNHKTRKLQLGAGSYSFEDWINTDLYENRGTNLIALDVTKRFPFASSSIDYIFSEHLIEHFTYQLGQFILEECFRVLKPGGKIRTATPDLRFLIELYSPKKSSLQKRYIKWAVNESFKDVGIYEDTFVINNFVRAWGHQFIYDYKSLKTALMNVGFEKINVFKPGESMDLNLKNLESHGTFISKEYNDLESMVLEASKPH